jgi:taurine dioxygenase
MAYRTIEVTPLTPTIGALVSGVALNGPLPSDAFEEIKAALYRHHVIFFRDQPLTKQDMHRLGSAFGPLSAHEFMEADGDYPEVHVTSHTGSGPNANARWHTDVTFRREPSCVHLLRPLELPASGGDTLWCSTAAAFDALPDPMKTLLLSLRAEHDLPYHMRRMWSGVRPWDNAREVKQIEQNPAVVHPAVITHPVTGRLMLFVNHNWTKKFLDVDLDLSDQLLKMCLDWVKKPEFQVRFRWERDSLAIWDNFATQHLAVTDYAPAYRAMQRVTAGSARPMLDMNLVPEHLRPPTGAGRAAAE